MKFSVQRIRSKDKELLLETLHQLYVPPAKQSEILNDGWVEYLLIKNLPTDVSSVINNQMEVSGGKIVVLSASPNVPQGSENLLLICSPAQLRHLTDALKEHPSSVAKELAETILVILNETPEQWVWKFCNRRFDLRDKVLIMGILNVTPDSFSDGGKYFTLDAALRRAEEMVEEGADIIDVGGESSRPGAQPVSLEEERRRVIPVISSLKKRLEVPISVDTYKYEVASEAISAGAEIVNDITGLRHSANMKALVAAQGVGLVIMHMQGTPQTMQVAPHYNDVVEEIGEFLEHQVSEAKQSGIAEECIVVDPGIGFGKLLEHNLEILANLEQLRLRCRRPVLIGVSRKSFIGHLLGGIPPEERVAGGLGAVLSAVMNGARIVRVHDVRATRHALSIYESITQFYRKGKRWSQ